jgi:hypothetical protein
VIMVIQSPSVRSTPNMGLYDSFFCSGALSPHPLASEIPSPWILVGSGIRRPKPSAYKVSNGPGPTEANQSFCSNLTAVLKAIIHDDMCFLRYDNPVSFHTTLRSDKFSKEG